MDANSVCWNNNLLEWEIVEETGKPCIKSAVATANPPQKPRCQRVCADKLDSGSLEDALFLFLETGLGPMED